MGQALYRKHRSTSLSEIIGQEHITTALEQAIKTGRISHAYLFTGPRGTGKTSIARILAHAINELAYSSDPHLDIIEIDAASNRRIDEIRDLRDKVYIAPTSAKYKVYIIDEVHMLTREAFNALLKTLEEPPAHVVFILATTDAHKLPETIVSRTQRYNFRPVELSKVAAHLANIAKAEGIKADSAALQLLAEHGEGSFRDSISMLDQVSNHGDKITLDSVRTQLGIPPEEAITSLLQQLGSSAINTPVIELQKLYDNGYRAPVIAEQLATGIRTGLINNSDNQGATYMLPLLKELLNVASAHNPERYLEIILMQVNMPSAVHAAVPRAPKATAPTTSKPIQVKRSATPTIDPEPIVTPAAVAAEPEALQAPDPLPELPETPIMGQSALDETSWAAVLAELKKQYNTVYGIVRMAKTDFSEPGTVTLGFTFAFHQKRINDAKNRTIVSDTIAAVTGQQIRIVCVLAANPTVDTTPVEAKITKPASVDKLQDISSVFGGAELL